jgi:hypothetical protein
MITSEQVTLYRSYFRGRMDVYARYWEKNGKSGYSPAYSFNWNEFFEHKNKGGTMATFANKTLTPLTDDVLHKHLSGEFLAGIYPITEDSCSYFLAADFDGEGWLQNAYAYIQEAAKVGLTAYLEMSKSGNGGHAWIFFENAYPCYRSRQIGLAVVRCSQNISPFQKDDSLIDCFLTRIRFLRMDLATSLHCRYKEIMYATEPCNSFMLMGLRSLTSGYILHSVKSTQRYK